MSFFYRNQVGQTYWISDSSPLLGGGGVVSSSTVTGEIPSGVINGINGTFTLVDIPVFNSVKLYLNGLRLKNTVDYTVVGSTITMTTIPYVGDTLIADYEIIALVSSVGETPAGVINGINGTFTVSNPPILNSLAVYLNGLRLKNGMDYTLVGATITMTTIPYVGDTLIVDYQY